MSASLAVAAGLQFRPMDESDLAWVAAQDAELYPFPWSAGNFADSISAGYGCWLMLDGAERVGYGVLMMVIDEAHILNISVVAARQRGGLGRRLLEHFAGLAREAGARRLLLEVCPSNVFKHALPKIFDDYEFLLYYHVFTLRSTSHELILQPR